MSIGLFRISAAAKDGMGSSPISATKAWRPESEAVAITWIGFSITESRPA
jgi:hypothetical protein